MTGSTQNRFGEVLAQYIPAHAEFYDVAVRAYSVLEQVAQISETDDTNEMELFAERVKAMVANIQNPALLGQTVKEMASEYEHNSNHGITFLIRKGIQAERRPKPCGENPEQEGSKIDELLVDSRPYNGVPHFLNDADVVKVVSERRYRDLATVIDETGYISHANVPLPVPNNEYRKEYGLSGKFEELLGEEESPDGLGARKLSALCASWTLDDDAVILTLHEKNAQGKHEISAWYAGARIYNSEGREMRTELLHFYPLPRGVAVYNELRREAEQAYTPVQPEKEAQPAALRIAA